MAGIRPLRAVAVLAPFLALPLTAPTARAQADCEWYARTAVRQQQLNEERKCGFKGDAWHKDLSLHLKWCGGVAPDLWKGAAQQRERQLAGCERR